MHIKHQLKQKKKQLTWQNLRRYFKMIIESSTLTFANLCLLNEWGILAGIWLIYIKPWRYMRMLSTHKSLCRLAWEMKISEKDLNTGRHQLSKGNPHLAELLPARICISSISVAPKHLSSTLVSIWMAPSFNNSAWKTSIRKYMLLY